MFNTDTQRGNNSTCLKEDDVCRFLCWCGVDAFLEEKAETAAWTSLAMRSLVEFSSFEVLCV